MGLFYTAFVIVVLIFIGAFFAISEISLAASRKFKLEQLLNEGEARAGLVLGLQAQPGIFFTAIQIGLNTVAILAGVFGDLAFAEPLSKVFEHFISTQNSGIVGVLLSFLLVTSLFILFAGG